MNNQSRLYTPQQKKQAFLLSFFSKPDVFEFKEVNGFILQKFQNGATQEWGVMIYTKDSWFKAQKYVSAVHPEKIKNPDRKTKFRNLYNDLNRAIRER